MVESTQSPRSKDPRVLGGVQKITVDNIEYSLQAHQHKKGEYEKDRQNLGYYFHVKVWRVINKEMISYGINFKIIQVNNDRGNVKSIIEQYDYENQAASIRGVQGKFQISEDAAKKIVERAGNGPFEDPGYLRSK